MCGLGVEVKIAKSRLYYVTVLCAEKSLRSQGLIPYKNDGPEKPLKKPESIFTGYIVKCIAVDLP